MSVAELSHMRSSAQAIGISEREWATLRQARLADTLRFFVELRRALFSEYESGTAFHLPSRELAAQAFLPGRTDHKLYLRLTQELIRLGLVVRIKPAGFSAEGRRTPASFLFTAGGDSKQRTVVFLTQYRGAARGS